LGLSEQGGRERLRSFEGVKSVAGGRQDQGWL
jgi:hypothetical protein